MFCSSADFSMQVARPVSVAKDFKVLDMVVLHKRSPDTVGGAGLTASASACIVQTKSLAAVLPIPASFSLDCLDYWLFRELQRQAGHIIVSPAHVEHSLSVQSMKSMGIERYVSILAAELAFLSGELGYSRIRHLLWHAGRTLKFAITTRRLALIRVCSRAALNTVRAP